MRRWRRTRRTCGVVEDGHDVDVQVTASVDGFVEHEHGVAAHHARTVERLGPGHQNAHVQALLRHRERERETLSHKQKWPIKMTAMHSKPSSLVETESLLENHRCFFLQSMNARGKWRALPRGKFRPLSWRPSMKLWMHSARKSNRSSPLPSRTGSGTWGTIGQNVTGHYIRPNQW